MISIVIPAHNEARVIGRLLAQLVSGPQEHRFDVIVVANGCSDQSAEIAASFGPTVRVASVPVASKRGALDAGDRMAQGFPRIYVDADVEICGSDVLVLATALDRPGVLAVAPERTLDLTGRPWLVRSYYDVWSRLPEVRNGLFGRGVIGVSEEGHQRLSGLPSVLADDLAASLAFATSERMVVPDAHVVVHTPRTWTDLMRRRIRAVVTVDQIERVNAAPAATARTRQSDLVVIARREPRMAIRVAIFLAVAVLARLGARRAMRRGDYATWLRDESSRDS